MIALYIAAEASCVAPLPNNHVVQEAVPATGPVHVFTWRDAETTARDLRVRDATGQRVAIEVDALGHDVLRLSPPEGGWPTGQLTLEERAGFELDGRRVRQGRLPHHSAWFRIHDLTVTAGPADDLTLPPLEWRRTSQRSSYIEVQRKDTSDAQTVELELEGHGPILFRRWYANASYALTSTANVRCNDTGRTQRLPTTGTLRARLVAHGALGERGVSPWVLLGPDGPIPDTMKRRPRADLSGMDGWRPVATDDDDTPTIPTIGDCSRLVIDDQKITKSEPRAKLIADNQGAFHTVVGRGSRSVDGVAVDGVVRSLVAMDEDLYVLAGTQVLQITDGAIVQRWQPELGRPRRLAADGAQLVAIVEHEGRRMRVPLSRRLHPSGATVPVLEPVLVDRFDGGTRVNGVVVSDLPHRNVVQRDDRVVLDFGEGALQAFGPGGSVVWEIAVDRPLGMMYRTADGITWQSAERTFRGVDWDGRERPVTGRPDPYEAPTSPRLMFNGHEVHTPTGVSLANPAGWSAPWGYGNRLAVDGERLRAARIDYATGRRTDTWLVCDPELIGIPARYLPTDAP